MKRNPSSPPSSPPPTSTQPTQHKAEDWDQGDELWNLLSEASKTEPEPFFARNVVRTVRLDENSSTTTGTRIFRFFTSRKVISINSKLALGAAACACVMLGYQLWPTPETATTTPTIAQVAQPSETTNNLSELVIEETLLAAADDPTMFTRDEVVAMLGL